MARRENQTWMRRLTVLALLLLALTGCRGTSPEPETAAQPTATPTAHPGPIDDEEATLSSLRKLDDHPLYTMRYQGAYEHRDPIDTATSAETGSNAPRLVPRPGWSCSLFAALGDPDSPQYGRNFDWEHSPALLLVTDPPDGYASASMVDIAYLGFSQEALNRLDELPLDERRPLLRAPLMPFDGMNEHGLAVGMAAVPPGGVLPDPAKETVGSLEVIREMLDHARTVDEAVVILQSYNIIFDGGPPLHYLVAEPSGQAALVELYQGELVVIRNTEPWHLATNFLRASVEDTSPEDSPEEQCWRYELISEKLAGQAGRLGRQSALDLLASVSQPNTQWSVVYGMDSGEIALAMGRQFDHPLELALTMALR
jgi:hypothetical protein